MITFTTYAPKLINFSANPNDANRFQKAYFTAATSDETARAEAEAAAFAENSTNEIQRITGVITDFDGNPELVIKAGELDVPPSHVLDFIYGDLKKYLDTSQSGPFAPLNGTLILNPKEDFFSRFSAFNAEQSPSDINSNHLRWSKSRFDKLMSYYDSPHGSRQYLSNRGVRDKLLEIYEAFTHKGLMRAIEHYTHLNPFVPDALKQLGKN
jgi:hypothetical protein